MTQPPCSKRHSVLPLHSWIESHKLKAIPTRPRIQTASGRTKCSSHSDRVAQAESCSAITHGYYPPASRKTSRRQNKVDDSTKIGTCAGTSTQLLTPLADPLFDPIKPMRGSHLRSRNKPRNRSAPSSPKIIPPVFTADISWLHAVASACTETHRSTWNVPFSRWPP